MTRKPVILSCADNATSKLEGWQMLLEENGYQVLTAANGKEAVRAFVSNTVDLVLIDCHMPQIDGGEAAMQMKVCKPDVPIALLSGDEWLPPSALEAVDTLISKSEPTTGLLEKVDYLLSLRLLLQPLESSWADEAGAQHKHKHKVLG
jgi:two-component system, sensor histidine kinase and response regulator